MNAVSVYDWSSYHDPFPRRYPISFCPEFESDRPFFSFITQTRTDPSL